MPMSHRERYVRQSYVRFISYCCKSIHLLDDGGSQRPSARVFDWTRLQLRQLVDDLISQRRGFSNGFVTTYVLEKSQRICHQRLCRSPANFAGQSHGHIEESSMCSVNVSRSLTMPSETRTLDAQLTAFSTNSFFT